MATEDSHGPPVTVPAAARVLIDGMLDGAVLIDRQRHVLYCNTSYSQLVGISARRLADRIKKGVFCHELLKLDVCDTACVGCRAMEKGQPQCMFEVNGRRPDGETLKVIVSSTAPLPGLGDGLVIESYRDVTAEARVQQRYQKQLEEERNRKVELEKAVTERTQELASANQRLGKYLDDLAETNVRLEESYAALKNEQALREEEMRRTLRAEMDKERYRAVAQMVTGLAHEMNTPLGIVNTAAGIVEKRLAARALGELITNPQAASLLEDVREGSALLQSNVARIGKLVQGFKMLSVSQIADTRETHDLSTLIREIVSAYKLQAERAPLEVRLIDALEPEAQQWIGYRRYFTQILLNLLSNVERYAYPAGGGTAEIETQALIVGEVPSYRVLVRDFGRGISPRDLPRVFDAFFTTDRSKGGAGLGLAIVHNLVSTLHGTIEIRSEPGVRTEALVTLPRVVPA